MIEEMDYVDDTNLKVHLKEVHQKAMEKRKTDLLKIRGYKKKMYRKYGIW